MRYTPLSVLIGLLSVTSANPILHPRTTPTNTNNNTATTSNTAPCAAVSSAYFAPGNHDSTVPAQMAYDCIKSVPLNVTAAKSLMREMRPYINWQTTIAFLKNPPAEYVEKIQHPVDILAGLDEIEALIDSGAFFGEYDFGFALYRLIQSAHDGHFSIILDSVGDIFNFGRTVPLVSVSEDGLKLPAVFAYADVLGQQFNTISYTPSAVVQIDGQDAATWLENWSQWGILQDRDALYNNIFYELAQVSLGSSGTGTGTFSGGGRGRWVFPGANTTLTFANGTSQTIENYAHVLINMNGIDSGEKLQQYFNYFGSDAGNAGGEVNLHAVPDVKAAAAATGSGSPPGYPPIIVAGPSNLINGYYIDSPDYNDVAVLSVPNFVGDADYEIAFQATTRNFVAKALADGKTKLIIDVSANGGGTVMQGYDLFKQLFPSILPYGATRWRAHEAADLIGQSYSAAASQYPRELNTIQFYIQAMQSTYFDYESDDNVDYKPFTSWPEKYAPRVYNGDNFTGIARYNLSDVLISINSGGINITGYGPLANYTKQPFKADNVIIVYDGYCASTCSIFSEFMRQQGGVKAFAMGGRPNMSPIQAVGGVKGVNNLDWESIQELAQLGVRAASPEEKQRYENSVLGLDYNAYGPLIRTSSYSSPGCNVRDGLREGDDSGTPLQFRYEEADCRLYYTPEMTVDVTAIWKAAADAQWGGKGKCVRDWWPWSKEKREVTTTLGRSRLGKRGADDAKVMEELLKTFAIRTDNQLTGDGFMKP
ncbi:peptidase S41 family protein [Lepidopterella palustris CBS 459.81]|uniref:Peptidase S41 family protein n=1 Tax=Lepidopterella palustris CBS 459.81 TaxID=1314670 RepID=A0A8E2E055_9PEZI|nr:peptidase S41 family protein [Lepidopterella palustris CBS 459.81]